MKIKLITLALAIATATLFGGQTSARAKTTGNPLEADIIVVGGGTAGSILMEELSANGLFTVLGIEAGKNATADLPIEAVGLPAFQLGQTSKPQYFWPGWRQNL